MFWAILVCVYVDVGVVVGTLKADVRKKKGKRRKELSHFILFAPLPPAILIGYTRIGLLPVWLFYPGETLFIIRYAFTIYSISVLGRYYSTYVEVLPDHKVIDSSPYRLIR